MADQPETTTPTAEDDVWTRCILDRRHAGGEDERAAVSGALARTRDRLLFDAYVRLPLGGRGQ
jgi:hypothetical protein